MKHHDKEFIARAYKGILVRSPDPGAFEHFLERLRDGSLTKIEILGRMRYSPEGREKAVGINGLLIKFVVQTSYRIPVLGRLFRILTGIFLFPEIFRAVQRNESLIRHLLIHTDEMWEKSEKRRTEDMARIDIQKADRKELAKFGMRKADREELAWMGNRKVDREELIRIRTERIDSLHERLADQERRLRRLLEEMKTDKKE